MRARAGSQKGERGRGVVPPEAAGATQRQRMTGFPRLWSWAAAWGVGADRRTFRGRWGSESIGANRRGSFPNQPSEPCGGAGVSCRRAASDLPAFPPERPAGFSFPGTEPSAVGFSGAVGFDVRRVLVFRITRRIDPGTRTLCARDVIADGGVAIRHGGRPGYSGHKFKERAEDEKNANPCGGPGGRRMWRLNRQTRPHNPGPAREVGRGFLRRATVKPWGGPQGQRGRNRGRNHTEGSNRQFRSGWAEFPGQFVVFPIPVSDVREIERKRNFESGGKPRHFGWLQPRKKGPTDQHRWAFRFLRGGCGIRRGVSLPGENRTAWRSKPCHVPREARNQTCPRTPSFHRR